MIIPEREENRLTVPRAPTRASVGRGVLWSAGGGAASKGAALIAFLLIARELDPDAFGLVALASLFITILSVFVEQGFPQALVQRQSIDDVHLSTAFWANVCISATLAVIIVLAAAPISAAFSEPGLAVVLKVLSLSLVLGAFSGVQVAILQRHMRFGVLATRSFAGTAVGGLVGVALALTGFGVWALVAQTLVVQAVTAVALWMSTGWSPRAVFSFDRLRELWSFGVNVLGSRLVNLANIRTAHIMIALVLDKRALGLYSVAAQIEGALSGLLINTVTRVSLATLSRFQGNLPMFRRVYFAGVRLTAAFGVPAFVGVAALAPDITVCFLGPQWTEAAPIVSILALLGVVSSVGAFNVTAIASLGFPRYNFQLDALNAAFTVCAIAVALPWGLTGVAFAFVARAYLLWPVRFLVLRRLCGVTFRELGASLWGIVVSAGAMAALITWMRGFDLGFGAWSKLAGLTVVGALSYAACLAVLSPSTLREGMRLGRASITTAH